MTDILAPTEQEGTKSVLKTWLKKVGDTVAVDEPIVELETDKVAVEIAAPASGTLSEILIEPDAEVEPGTVLGRISDGAVEPVQPAPVQGTSVAAQKPAAAATRIPPGIRKLLADHGLGENDIEGPLTRESIQAEAERRAKGGDAAASGVRRVPHDSMRRRIAERMAHSVTVAPHVTAVFEADFSAIIAHRNAQVVKPTFTAYFVKAAAAAMEAAPAVNGRWFDDRIEIYEDVNVGIGTALGDKGLVVPVIQHAQTLDLLQIATELQRLTTAARDGGLAPADVRGGTFSISNHGTSGSLLATPIIINQPQAAILGIGKLEKRAVVRDDKVEIRPMAYVTLTIDHRMLDGHQTNAWLTKFVSVLEAYA